MGANTNFPNIQTDTAIPRVAGMVIEFGAINCSTGAWDAQTLTLGGMTFKWSQAAINGGNLTYIKATGTDAASAAGSQTVRKYAASVMTGLDNANDSVWTTAVTIATPSISMEGAYTSMEYNIMSRNGAVACWNIKVLHGGSNNLFISGTYMGPRYTG